MNDHVCLFKITATTHLHLVMYLPFTPSKMMWTLGWKRGNKLLHKLLKWLLPLTEANRSRKTNTVTDMTKKEVY